MIKSKLDLFNENKETKKIKDYLLADDSPISDLTPLISEQFKINQIRKRKGHKDGLRKAIDWYDLSELCSTYLANQMSVGQIKELIYFCPFKLFNEYIAE